MDDINIKGKGFVVHIEIFKKALDKGYSVKEIGFDTVGWQSGSFGIFKHGIPTVIDTIKLRLKLL